MAKDLPYFKFFPAEWMKGDITLCSMAAQGLFINICTYYWMKDGNMRSTSVERRFNMYSTELKELLEHEIITKNPEGGLEIEFLNEQLSEFTERRTQMSKAGKISAQKRGFNKRSTHVEQTLNYIEKDKDKDKEKNIYMSELKVSDPSNVYENIALSFWELCKANMKEFDINSTDLERARYKNWVTPIRLSIEKDNRTTDEFREVWGFLSREIPQKGFSWRQNIRSGSSLREKFEQLLMAARNPKINKSSTQIAHENLKRKFAEQAAD